MRSEIDNPDGVLKADMFATFRIATGSRRRVPWCPSTSIIRDGDAASVWVECEPRVFERRKVKLGGETERPGADPAGVQRRRARRRARRDLRRQRSRSDEGRLHSMLRGLIAFCLARRSLVLIAFAAFIGAGVAAFKTLNIEAYPDPAPPIIEIIAQWPGQSPEEVERYVTVPIEIAVSSTPGLKFTRSNTVFALGFIRLQFEYGRDYHFVRQQTINRLKDVQLPPGVQPVISPAGGISEIFRYQLTGPPGMDVMELKTIQDWVVERKLRIVPGVADVAVLGGNTKEYQVEVDLNQMMSYGLTLPQIISAISTEQLQRRRPHHRDRRAVGQRARHRRHHARSRTSATSC